MSLVGDKCDKCRHCMRVYDEDYGRTRWVCAVLKRTVKPLDGPCANYWGPEEGVKPEVPQEPYLPPEDLCKECRHRMVVYDEVAGRCRWACTTLRHMVVRPITECKEFKAGTLRTPYIAEMTFGKPLGLLTEMHLLEEFSVLLARLERLLLALELQPKVDIAPWMRSPRFGARPVPPPEPTHGM